MPTLGLVVVHPKPDASIMREEAPMELKRLVRIIRKRWILIVAFILLGVVGGAAAALLPSRSLPARCTQRERGLEDPLLDPPTGC